MKYPEQHKQEVGRRLRRQAAAQIRGKGMDAISVKSVMAAEGMTVGGFYAHFDSRKDLLVEALQSAFSDSKNSFYRHIEQLPVEQWMPTMLKLYLSEFHRDNIENSCPLSSLVGDVARQDESVKRVFQDGMQRMVDHYAGKLSGLDAEQHRQLALGLVSLMIGGIQLARAVADPDYSKQILEGCIASAERLIETTVEPASR
ncbi:MAG: TetR/AcrR family transcriptional regulator [Nevskiales bacterium]